jgi:hypothetical protein
MRCDTGCLYTDVYGKAHGIAGNQNEMMDLHASYNLNLLVHSLVTRQDIGTAQTALLTHWNAVCRHSDVLRFPR